MEKQKYTQSSVIPAVSEVKEMVSGSADTVGNVSEQYKVIRRNGSVVTFNPEKIKVAISKAFIATEERNMLGTAQREAIDICVANVIVALQRHRPQAGTFNIEEIQDQVELALMRGGHQKVARNYVLYREERRKEREGKVKDITPEEYKGYSVVKADGSHTSLDFGHLHRKIDLACQGLENVSTETVLERAIGEFYDGVKQDEVDNALVLAARAMIEIEPNYSFVSARLLLDRLRCEVFNYEMLHGHMEEEYPHHLREMLDTGVAAGLINPELKGTFDLKRLGKALRFERDLQFGYIGLQTLYDRYFLHVDKRRIEMPQTFFMRVAMGLALKEDNPTMRAIEFYNLLSTFSFMSSTPTLFNSGTTHPQLSSCYLSTVGDDLDGIYTAIKDNAMLAKFAGGLGNDWTPVRAMGSRIRGTNGTSQGVVPFLKVVNDTAVAVNQCFAPETQVHTADGFRRISAIQPGDLVLGHSGCYREVLEHLAYRQTDPMVSISVAHSLDPLMVTSGHPLMAVRRPKAGEETLAESARQGKRSPRWHDAGTLGVGDHVVQTVPRETVNVVGMSESDAHMAGIAIAAGSVSETGLITLDLSHMDANASRFARTYLKGQGMAFSEEADGSIRLVAETSARACAGGGAFPSSPVQDMFSGMAGLGRIPRRISHMPLPLTLSLAEGVISAGEDKGVTRLSRHLAEDVRYQLLRLGVPCRGRRLSLDETELDITVADIRKRMEACEGEGWFRLHGDICSRIDDIDPMDPLPHVHDLKVDVDESYMTSSTLAHNGGKRKGAVCCYLETWHSDIWEFLDLRKNSGDERRRTHDMNTANWIPDLFMKRVEQDQEWTLFSPNDVPDLHDKYGKAFEEAYVGYEEMAKRNGIEAKTVSAVELWRKMLTMLYATGHPWMVFKDSCNIRSPQQHQGVVHSSNLCTEITLNTSADEIAVCNLGSVNLVRHLKDGKLDKDRIGKTVRTAMRMLDNVIDINFYAVDKARKSNLRHRPVGLGIMGFQDCLYKMGISYASDEAVEFADQSMEAVAYHAYSASSDLAMERGSYETFEGSLWDQGKLPFDTIDMLEKERGVKVTVDRTMRLDWNVLREKIQRQGMRNSNCLAIAPTATIANIVGVTSSIEPTYQNMFVKSNLSGEFIINNVSLVDDLKKLDLWDETMVADVKYCKGHLDRIDRIPQDIKDKYPTAHEIDPIWLIRAAARRQKWIDQAQSLNLYVAEGGTKRMSGKRLDEIYRSAWRHGLKTTYYLRSLGASSSEKYTSDRTGEHNGVPTTDKTPLAAGSGGGFTGCEGDGTCEVCQ